MARPTMKRTPSALKSYYSIAREEQQQGGLTASSSSSEQKRHTGNSNHTALDTPPRIERPQGLNKYAGMLPIMAWLPQYSTAKFASDLISGITLASFQIPLSISLSTLAKLPPQSGLFSLIVPPLVYLVFGTVPSLVIGPQAVASMLVGHHIDLMSSGSAFTFENNSAARDRIQVASIITITCGAMLLGVGLGKYGFIDNALSKSFQRGFISSLAFMIFISSLMTELDMNGAYKRAGSAQSNGTSWSKLKFIWENTDVIDHTSMWITIVTVGFLLIARILKYKWSKTHPKIIFFPEILVVVIVSTVLSFFYKWNVSLVGELLEESSIEIRWPLTDFQKFRDSFDISLLVTVIGIFETATAYKTITEQSILDVSSNKELFAVGLSNVLCSLFGSIPAFGGYGRTKLNILTGVATPLSGVLVSLCSFIVMKYCLKWFYYLPQCSLSSIITLIALTLLEELPRDLHFYWKVGGYREIAVVFTIVVFTLVWSPQMGISMGLAITMFALLQQTTKSNITVLGKDPNTNQFKPIIATPQANARASPMQRSASNSSLFTVAERMEFEKIMIVEVPALLIFANTTDFKRKLIKLEKYGPSSSSKFPSSKKFPNHEEDSFAQEALESQSLLSPRNEPLRYLIIDFENLHTIDVSAIQSMKVIVQSYSDRGIFVFFTTAPKVAGLHEKFEQSGILKAQKQLVREWLLNKTDLSPEFINLVHTDLFESIESAVECIDYMEYISRTNDI
ncbi:hypothetical protein ACO0QE_000233 [Hanseniaspora vineae]